MAGERVVKVSLIANVSQYIAAMDQTARKTRETATEAQKLADKKQGMQDLGVALGAIGTIAAVGVGLAVSKFAEFDQAMSSVQAATHESTTNMGLLRQAALDAGAETVFSATESANAIEELSKAGVSTSDVLGGALSGSLSLASAGELGVAEAAEIAATAMTQFKEKGSEVPHIADLLAAGAGKAQGSVQDLGAALGQAGLVASSTGLSLDETVGTLSAFASAGLLGSDAGTSMKNMLQRLTPQSAEAQEAMDNLGISAYDASGQFIGMANFAGVLQQALKDKTDEERNSALATIFGSDAVRAANVLYEQGAEGIEAWNEKVDDSGYAAETARIKLDNLNGDIEKLGGSFDTFLIESGSGANDVLRFLTQTATNLVDGIGALPTPVLGAGLAVTGLVAGLGLLGGGMLLLIPKIAATRAAMVSMNLTGVGLAKSFGKGGAVLAGLAVLTAGLANMGSTASLTEVQLADLDAALKLKNLDTLNDQFKAGQTNAGGLQSAVTALTSGDFFQNQQANVGFGKFMAGLGIDIFYKDLRESEAKLKELGSTLGGLVDSDFPMAVEGFEFLAQGTDGTAESLQGLLDGMPGYEAALRSAATEMGINASDQDILSAAQGKGKIAAQLLRDAAAATQVELAGVGTVSKTVADDIDALSEKIRNFGSATLDTRDATRGFQQAVDDIEAAMVATTTNEAGETVSSFTATLDDSTQAGRDNNQMLDDLVKSTLELSASLVENENDTVGARQAVEDGRNAFIDLASQMGISRDAAAQLADQLGLIPTNVPITVTLTGTETVSERLAAIVSFWENRGINIPTYVLQQDEAAANRGPDGKAYGGTITGYAGGGTAYGPGTSKSDSILTRLSVGEEVVQQPYASQYRGALKSINSGQGIPANAYQTTRYVGGASSTSTISNTNHWNITAPDGPSAVVMGKSAAAYATRKQRRSFA